MSDDGDDHSAMDAMEMMDMGHLSRLPPELRWKLVEKENIWRCVCKTLRDDCYGHCKNLAWSPKHSKSVQRREAWKFCRVLETLTIDGITDDVVQDEGVSLDEVPASLVKISVTGTSVRGLDALGACKMLREVTLAWTAIETLEPLAACTAMEFLDVSNCDITGVRPLASCHRLKRLNVDGNTRLRGMDGLELLAALEHLSANNTGIRALVDYPEGTTPALTSVEFSRTWCDVDTRGLRHCANLERVVCMHSRTSSLKSASGLPRLACIDCSYSDVDALPTECESVRYLSCRASKVVHVPEYPRLLQLDVSWTDVHEVPRSVELEYLACAKSSVADLPSPCPSLRYADFSGTDVTSLEPLAPCKELRHVKMSDTSVRDATPLIACAKLEILECDRCIYAKGITDVIDACSSLYRVDCHMVTNAHWRPRVGLVVSM